MVELHGIANANSALANLPMISFAGKRLSVSLPLRDAKGVILMGMLFTIQANQFVFRKYTKRLALFTGLWQFYCHAPQSLASPSHRHFL